MDDSGPSGPENRTVSVHFDQRLVPHIRAGSKADACYAQGYVTAGLRLWQMELQTWAAGGRLSEFLGNSEELLKADRYHRRIGLGYGAENALESMLNDPETAELVRAYTHGVNDYISNLTYENYPIEYKLLNIVPTKWSELRTALLLKLMANDLTGRDNDVNHSNAILEFGLQAFNELYPEYYDHQVPIIPPSVYSDSGRLQASDSFFLPEDGIAWNPLYEPNRALGSNNWALSSSKSTSGNPVLCSDPHLALRLPGIWLEMHLMTDDLNVYGVALPGAPGVVIGFNDDIAWGMTNTSIDVRDWFLLETRNGGAEYLLDGEWTAAEARIEEIVRKGSETFLDTVWYTVFGPVVYDERFPNGADARAMALRWTAHLPSNELKALAAINVGKDYTDYMNALDHYTCPAQNFVFASREGDIAIRSQGRFPLRKGREGTLLRDGRSSSSLWNGFIPFRENPHVVNPERGYVSSANQHPTDTAYPYRYEGIFQYHRNKRINSILDSRETFSVDELMELQNDAYNLIAEECLPAFLWAAELSEESSASWIAESLTDWSLYNKRELKEPVLFQLWYDHFRELLWDEISESDKSLRMPTHAATIDLLKKSRESDWFDIRSTPEKENFGDIVLLALERVADEYASMDAVPDWGSWRGTKAVHLARIDPFSRKLYSDGNKDIVNATGKTAGPSWRMVVELSDPVRAWGVYPGGQSGEPGSPHYDDMIANWTEGAYYEMLNSKDLDVIEEACQFEMTITIPRR